jgi:hypothetical protein
VDFSKFKTSDWLKVGGALAFFIFGFFDWLSVEAGGITYKSGNVFDFTWTGVIPWLLILAVGIIAFLLAAGVMKPGNLPWSLIFLAASALATLLLLIRLLFNPLDGKDAFESAGGSVDRGIGMWLCTLAAIAVLAGSFLGFKESGGELSQLTDMNKLKSSFGGSTPPPPPPGMTPPPPPPPGGTPPPPPPPPPPA